MKFSGMKKILLLGMILLIIAGAVVVMLKGFNVLLLFQKHEELNIRIGKEINIQDINSICSEVFENKKFIVKSVELFDDSVSIRVESITNEEKESIINKINEKYGTEFVSEDFEIKTNPNIRIRDLIRPYIKPVIASSIVIICYLYLRYRKSNPFKFIGKSFLIILLTELCLASIIAIIRLPISPVVVNLMVTFAIIELLFIINKKEISLKK